jgi:hypothetical protein
MDGRRCDRLASGEQLPMSQSSMDCALHDWQRRPGVNGEPVELLHTLPKRAAMMGDHVSPASHET